METKKLSSILELTAGLNYLLSTGFIIANNKEYMNTVNAYKKEHKEALTIKITKCKSGMIYGGDNPTLNDGEEVIEEYSILAPVMLNLAINSLGARAYNLKVSESRTYKLPINEQMCLTEDDYKSVMKKLIKLENSPNPLPTTEDIKDFKWLKIEGDSQFIHKSNRKANVNKEKGLITSGSNSTNTSKVKPNLSAEELVRRVSKNDEKKSTEGIIRNVKLKINTNFPPVKVGKYTVFVADENTGLGFFNFVYIDDFLTKNYFSVELNKEDGEFNIIFQDNNQLETYMNEVVLTMAKGKFEGETIHNIKEKDKKDIVYNVSTYKVYRR